MDCSKKAEQPDEQTDTADMPDLESEESAAQRKSKTEKGHKYKPKSTHRNSKTKSDNYYIFYTAERK